MLKSVNYDQVEFYYILDILTIHYYKKQDLPEKNHFEMNIAEKKTAQEKWKLIVGYRIIHFWPNRENL